MKQSESTQGEDAALLAAIDLAVTAVRSGDRAFRIETAGDPGVQAVAEHLNGLLDAVADRTAWYESILDAIPFPLSVTDLERRWTFINRPVESFLGVARADVIGTACSHWNAPICGSPDCGITCLLNGTPTTFFDQQGGNFRVDTAFVTDARGRNVGHVEVVQDVTSMVRLSSYLTEEVGRLKENLVSLASGSLALDLSVAPPDAHTNEAHALFTDVNRELGTVCTAIRTLVDDAGMLTQAAAEGRLAARADASMHRGEFRKVVEGVNATLDAVIRPVNVAADIVDQISRGVIPAKVTDEAHGDFLLLKTSLNACIDGLQALVEANTVLARMAVNDHTTEVRGQYQGLFADVKAHVNLVRERVNHIAGSIERIGNGDLGEYEEYRAIGRRSDQDRVVPGFVRTLGTLQALIGDVTMLSQAAVEGRLATRADPSKHHGDYRKIVEGVNATLDQVLEPVNEAIRVAHSFANADFTARVSPKLRVAGDFVRFKEALDNIGIQVSKTVTMVNKQVTDLAAVSEEANASVEEVTGSARQVTQNAERVNLNAEKGSQGLNQVLRAMTDLSAAVEEVTSSAESVSHLSKNANVLSKDGAELARQADRGMAAITGSTADVDVIITEITSEMRQIGKIVGLISDLASQTNLLALNAAIEAARAGDAGRGFAVVAAEVKSLAQESRASAENIADMIGELQRKSERAGEATAAATREVQAGSTVLQQTLEVFNRIVADVEMISKAAEEVAAATEEQAATVEEITASIHEVGALVENTSTEAGNAAAASEEATASIEEVRRIVENVNVIVDSVSREMTRFTV